MNQKKVFFFFSHLLFKLAHMKKNVFKLIKWIAFRNANLAKNLTYFFCFFDKFMKIGITKYFIFS